MSIEFPMGVLDFNRSFQEATESEGAEVHVPDPVVDSSRPTYSPMQVVETLTHALFLRMPPLALTYRTSKRSGYSSRPRLQRPALRAAAGPHGRYTAGAPSTGISAEARERRIWRSNGWTT